MRLPFTTGASPTTRYSTAWCRTTSPPGWRCTTTGCGGHAPALTEREFRRYLECGILAHGFSLDTSVRIEANDRQGLERLLRYYARPAFAQERLRQLDPEHLVYESKKPGPGGKVSVLLTPHQLLDRISALIPPPRRHRHRYYGVLAPNSPWRSGVTALAAAPESSETATAEGKAEAETEETHVRQAARFVWAMLLARIYEVLPLICPKCGGTMKIIAFIDEGDAIRKILTHLGEPVDPPRLTPARGPPLWEAAGQCGDDLLIQPLPEYEFDQRIAW